MDSRQVLRPGLWLAAAALVALCWWTAPVDGQPAGNQADLTLHAAAARP